MLELHFGLRWVLMVCLCLNFSLSMSHMPCFIMDFSYPQSKNLYLLVYLSILDASSTLRVALGLNLIYIVLIYSYLAYQQNLKRPTCPTSISGTELSKSDLMQGAKSQITYQFMLNPPNPSRPIDTSPSFPKYIISLSQQTPTVLSSQADQQYTFTLSKGLVWVF